MKKSNKKTQRLLTKLLQYAGVPSVLAGLAAYATPIVMDYIQTHQQDTTASTPKPKEYGTIADSNVKTDSSKAGQAQTNDGAIPAFNGQALIDLGASGFSDSDWALSSSTNGLPYVIKPVDHLGRPQQADAILSTDVYKGSRNRPRITVDPPGWDQEMVSINGQEDELYNRSHLLAYAFMNDNIDTKENLVTGLEDFNQSTEFGMQYVEKEVEELIKSGYTVRYQVVMIYQGDELVPRGCYMRYQSEDKMFDKTYYVHNVMEGVEIDYQTGKLLKN